MSFWKNIFVKIFTVQQFSEYALLFSLHHFWNLSILVHQRTDKTRNLHLHHRTRDPSLCLPQILGGL
jgi:hypothetical protein